MDIALLWIALAVVVAWNLRGHKLALEIMVELNNEIEKLESKIERNK